MKGERISGGKKAAVEVVDSIESLLAYLYPQHFIEENFAGAALTFTWLNLHLKCVYHINEWY